jgi:putative oxidoreductase
VEHLSVTEEGASLTGILGPITPTIYTLLRIVAGLLFAQHGAQKLFGVLGGRQPPLISQLGLAGIIEFFGGLLIAVGLATSPVAFVASVEMVWAYAQNHMPRGLWPIQNGGELAAVYAFLFLYFAATGSGKWSVDGIMRRGR